MTALRRALGSGDPVTLVVPGLGATAGEARIPASGLPGTRVVLTLPSHADAPDAPPDYWRYPRVAADVAEAADAVGARRAIGVSLGAGALTRLAADRPDRFDRLVLLLPAVLAGARRPESRRRVEALAAAVESGDRERLRALVAEGLPDGVGAYPDDRAAALSRLGPALRALDTTAPVASADELSQVRAEVLVIAATGDPLHPAEAAEEVAAAFPRGRLAVLPSAAPLVTHRREVRALVAGFLSEPAPARG